MSAIWVEAQIDGGRLCSPVPQALPQGQLIYTNPHAKELIGLALPRRLQSCSLVRAKSKITGDTEYEYESESDFILAHDALGRSVFLVVDSAHRQVWETVSNLFESYPYRVPAWTLHWTRASLQCPLSCCHATRDLGPELLTAAADLGLASCEEVCAWVDPGSAYKCLLRDIVEFDPRAKFRCVVLAGCCSLCGFGYSLRRRAVRLSCGHVFHADAYCSIGHALRRHAACPLCQKREQREQCEQAAACALVDLAGAGCAQWAALLKAVDMDLDPDLDTPRHRKAKAKAINNL
jgi:hypothetical protein